MFMSHHMVYYKRLTYDCVKQNRLTSTWVTVTVFNAVLKKYKDFRLPLCLTNVPSKLVIGGLAGIIEHEIGKPVFSHEILKSSLEDADAKYGL